jgi:hypothetical protein
VGAKKQRIKKTNTNMSNLAANECRQQLRYSYTPDERIAKSVAHATSLNNIDRTNADLDRIKADFKSRLSALEAEEALLRDCVANGYELREYLCFWTYDEPRAGRKTLRKREGGEFVAEEDMTERDRQMVMEIIESQAAASGSAEGESLAIGKPREWPEISELQNLLDTADEATKWLAEIVFDLFTDPSSSIDKGLILSSRETVGNVVAGLLSYYRAPQIAEIVGYLATAPLPGAAWVRNRILLAQETERAQTAALKRAAKKGRRAEGSGTVSVESDEGSRDDSGADSKNDL